MKRFLFLAIAASAGFAALSAHASVITLAPYQDGTLYQDETGESANGSGFHLFAGSTEFGNIRRAVMAFDVVGSIPAGSTINSASLELNVSRCGPTCVNAVTMSLHAVTSAWGEGASVAFGQEGIPTQPESGDATWLYTYYPDQVWNSPGGDFSPVVSSSEIVSGLGSYSWNSTPEMVADVQSWLDSPEINFGWLLEGGEEITTTAKRFDSRESGFDLGPRLTIDFTPVPEPSTILFVSTGMIALLRFRRRSN